MKEEKILANNNQAINIIYPFNWPNDINFKVDEEEKVIPVMEEYKEITDKYEIETTIDNPFLIQDLVFRNDCILNEYKEVMEYENINNNLEELLDLEKEIQKRFKLTQSFLEIMQ